MNELLPGAIWTLTVFAWVSAIVLVRAARGAHIGALTERAVAAVLVAVFGTAYSLVVYNTEVAGYLPMEVSIMVVRVTAVVLLLVPCYWSLLYITCRLGKDE